MLRRLAAIATALVATALLPATQATAGTDPDPMAGAPAAGDCYDLTLEDVEGYDTTKTTVDCAGDHTAVVSGVGKLPAAIAWREKSKVMQVVLKQCPPTWNEMLGSENRLHRYRSQYGIWWLAPSQADRDAGARWFSCLVTIQDDRGLVDLPDTLPKLTKDLPDVVARCVTRKYAYTTCADTHAWRSSHAFYATGKATDRNVVRAANRVCPRHVTTPRNWLRSAWDVEGKRFVVACYSKTAR